MVPGSWTMRWPLKSSMVILATFASLLHCLGPGTTVGCYASSNTMGTLSETVLMQACSINNVTAPHHTGRYHSLQLTRVQNMASYEDNGCENHMVKDMNFPTGRETESYSIRYMWPNVDGRRWEVWAFSVLLALNVIPWFTCLHAASLCTYSGCGW